MSRVNAVGAAAGDRVHRVDHTNMRDFRCFLRKFWEESYAFSKHQG